MRLRPLTDEIPTPLLYLPGGTVLDYLLHHLSFLPIHRAVAVLQYRGDRIAPHLAPHGIEAIPQYAPFTWLGALASAAPWIEGPTLVLHANHFFSHDLRYFLSQSRPDYPAVLVPPPNGHGPARPGAYLLPPESFYAVARHVEADGASTLYAALAEAGTPPHQVYVRGWSQAIRTPGDLLAVNHYLLGKWHEVLHPPEAGVGYDAINFNWIAPEARLADDCTLLFSTVGPGAEITQSRLSHTLVFPDVHFEGERERGVIFARQADSLLRLYAPESLPRSRRGTAALMS